MAWHGGTRRAREGIHVGAPRVRAKGKMSLLWASGTGCRGGGGHRSSRVRSYPCRGQAGSACQKLCRRRAVSMWERNDSENGRVAT